MLVEKTAFLHWDHSSFSTYAKFSKKLTVFTPRYTQGRLTLILFGDGSKHWRSSFTDKREGSNLQMFPKNTLKVFSEDNHYISAIVVYIFLICTFYFFSVFHGTAKSTNKSNGDS